MARVAIAIKNRNLLLSMTKEIFADCLARPNHVIIQQVFARKLCFFFSFFHFFPVCFFVFFLFSYTAATVKICSKPNNTRPKQSDYGRTASNLRQTANGQRRRRQISNAQEEHDRTRFCICHLHSMVDGLLRCRDYYRLSRVF